MAQTVNIVYCKQTLTAARAFEGRIVSIVWHGLPPDANADYGERLLPQNWGDEVYKAAINLSDNWYKKNEIEYLRVEGIAYGTLLKTSNFHYFVEHLRVYQAAQAIIAEYGNSYRLFDDGSRYFHLIRNAFESFGCNLQIESAGSTERIFDKDWLKRRFHWPIAYLYYTRKYRTEEAKAGFKPGALPIPDNPILYLGQFGATEIQYYVGISERIGKPAYYVTLRPAGYGEVCKQNLPGKGVYDFLPRRGNWRKINFELTSSYREMAKAGGPFVNDYFNDSYTAFIHNDFVYRPQAYLIHKPILFASINKMIEEVNPSVIVHSGDTHPSGFLTAIIAKEKNIPTINIQNGVTAVIGKDGFRADAGSYAFLPISSNHFCTWGKYSKEWLVAGGADPEKIIITGSLNANHFQKRLQEVELEASKKSRPDKPDGKIILVATNDLDRIQNRHLLLAALETARKYPDWTFLFRPHPSETGEVQEGLLEAAGLDNALIDRSGIAALCLRLDAAIIGQSGIGVELICAKVPTVLVNFMDFQDYLPYVETGAMLGAYNIDEIGTQLEKAIAIGKSGFEEGREKFIKQYLGGNINPFKKIANIVSDVYSASVE